MRNSMNTRKITQPNWNINWNGATKVKFGAIVVRASKEIMQKYVSS